MGRAGGARGGRDGEGGLGEVLEGEGRGQGEGFHAAATVVRRFKTAREGCGCTQFASQQI